MPGGKCGLHSYSNHIYRWIRRRLSRTLLCASSALNEDRIGINWRDDREASGYISVIYSNENRQTQRIRVGRIANVSRKSSQVSIFNISFQICPRACVLPWTFYDLLTLSKTATSNLSWSRKWVQSHRSHTAYVHKDRYTKRVMDICSLFIRDCYGHLVVCTTCRIYMMSSVASE